MITRDTSKRGCSFRLQFWYRIQFIFLLFVFSIILSKAQENAPEQISITLTAKDFGQSEVPALIIGQNVYILVKELFNYFHIHQEINAQTLNISGYIYTTKDAFIISGSKASITYKNKNTLLTKDELILLEEDIYLRSDLFETLFGLKCQFNIRALSLQVTPQYELPFQQMKKLDKSRLAFRNSNKTFVPDTIFPKKSTLFNLGMADWSVHSTSGINQNNYSRLGLIIGGTLIGGELRTAFTLTPGKPFDQRQQHYKWRMVNNNNRFIRQISAGKIPVQTVSTVFDPVVGLQISNASSTIRRSFGTYTITDYTIPGTLIEIFINHSLFGYSKTDASGMYIIEIPIAYGSSKIHLEFYSPTGERFNQQKHILIPNSLLPSNTFEYTVSAGFLENAAGSFYSQGRFYYGLTDNISLGAGMEYLGAGKNFLNLPFINTTLRLSNNAYLQAEYVSGTRFKGSFTYNPNSRVQLELHYTKYNGTQEAIKYNYNEIRRATLSLPIKINHTFIVSKLSYNQYTLNTSIKSNVEYQVALTHRKIQFQTYLYSYLSNSTKSHTYAQFSGSLYLPGNYRISPRLHYQISDQQLLSYSIMLDKTLSKNWSVHFLYERRFQPVDKIIRVGVKANLAFARFHFSTTHRSDATIFSQSMAGSIIHSGKANYLDFNRNSMSGSSGILFRSYLDINANGQKDFQEFYLKGLKVKSSGGGGKTYYTDTTIMIVGLEANILHLFKINGDEFENISWKIIKPSIGAHLIPNQIKVVEIPVVPVGEISGVVIHQNTLLKKDLDHLKINILNEELEVVASLHTQSDGSFHYLGLLPGQYTIEIDEEQLRLLNLSYNQCLSFKVLAKTDGDIVELPALILN